MRNAIGAIFLIFIVTSKIKSQVSFTLSNTACSGNTKTVSANTGTDIPISYTWTASPQVPIFATPNSATTNINLPTAGMFTINLAVNLLSGFGTYSNIITVAASPTITVAQSSPTTCIMSNYPLYSKAVTLSATGASTYTWTPSLPSMTGNGSLKTVRPPISTCYTITGIVGTCTGSAVKCVSVIPQFSVEVFPTSGIRCLDSYLELSVVNVQTTGIAPFTYQWTEAANAPPPSAIPVSPTVIDVFPLNNTSYTLEATDVRNCISLPTVISVTVQSCVGIKPNFQNIENILFYPNPVKDKLYLDFEQNKIEKISITNSLGQILITLNNPISKQEIDLSSFSGGVYFLKVERIEGQSIFKILKE